MSGREAGMREDGQGSGGPAFALWGLGAACGSFQVHQEATQASAQGGSMSQFSFFMSLHLLFLPVENGGTRK